MRLIILTLVLGASLASPECAMPSVFNPYKQ